MQLMKKMAIALVLGALFLSFSRNILAAAEESSVFPEYEVHTKAEGAEVSGSQVSGNGNDNPPLTNLEDLLVKTGDIDNEVQKNTKNWLTSQFEWLCGNCHDDQSFFPWLIGKVHNLRDAVVGSRVARAVGRLSFSSALSVLSYFFPGIKWGISSGAQVYQALGISSLLKNHGIRIVVGTLSAMTLGTLALSGYARGAAEASLSLGVQGLSSTIDLLVRASCGVAGVFISMLTRKPVSYGYALTKGKLKAWLGYDPGSFSNDGKTVFTNVAVGLAGLFIVWQGTILSFEAIAGLSATATLLQNGTINDIALHGQRIAMKTFQDCNMVIDQCSTLQGVGITAGSNALFGVSPNLSLADEEASSIAKGLGGQVDEEMSAGAKMLGNRSQTVLTETEINLLKKDIPQGHAFEKHFLLRKEIPGVETREQLSEVIEEILRNPDFVKMGHDNRKAFWSNKYKAVVIYNPNVTDGSTIFKPDDGFEYITERFN